MHVLSHFGDVSGDGRINASDAATLARTAALLQTGFAANPTTDPILLGDISGNGRVNGFDATLVARSAALLEVPQIPPLPAAALTVPLVVSGTRPAMTDLHFPAPQVGLATKEDADWQNERPHPAIGVDPHSIDIVIARVGALNLEADEMLIAVLENAVSELAPDDAAESRSQRIP